MNKDPDYFQAQVFVGFLVSFLVFFWVGFSFFFCCCFCCFVAVVVDFGLSLFFCCCHCLGFLGGCFVFLVVVLLLLWGF